MLMRLLQITCWLPLLLGLFGTSVMAADETVEQPIDIVKKEIQLVDSLIKNINPKRLSVESANGFIDQLSIHEPKLQAQEKKLDALIETIKKDIAKLGDKDKIESKDVTKKRNELLNESKKLEKAKLDVNEYLKKIEAERQRLLAIRKSLYAKQYLGRGPHLLQMIPAVTREHTVWQTTTTNYFVKSFKDSPPDIIAMVIIVALVILVFIIGSLLHKALKRTFSCDSVVSSRSFKLKVLLCEYNKYLPHLLVVAVALISYSLMSANQNWPLMGVLLYAILVYYSARPFINSLFKVLNGSSSESPENALRIKRLLSYTKLLLLSLLLGYFMYGLVVQLDLGGVAQYLVQDLFIMLIAINVYFGVSKLLAYRESAFGSLFRYVSLLFIFSVLTLEFSGYRSLSYYLFTVFLGTTFGISVFWYLSGIVRELTTAIQTADSHWHTAFNRVFRDRQKVAEASLFWMKILLKSILWVALVIFLVWLFGVYGTLNTYVQQYFYNGFSIGNITVSPYKILLAFLVFVVVQSISGWLKKLLNENLLKKEGYDHGAREAMVTILGYIGFALALMIGLGIAGVSFTNLAIIAGALSVGIGFGLQNIVSNFVSGLILLFERPIKTGDWVVVGEHEGYVKKISIRATIIQTFDNAEIVVPNSEFISNRFTNWMYSNRRGRVKVPIGVAYGSDTNKVIEVLMKAAENNDKVIQNDSSWPIRVLFMGFGDSALLFELRCFINNIDERLKVISEINHLINDGFAKEGIQIPFPQRDVHLFQEK